MPKIRIRHQLEGTYHSFTVADPNNLTQQEANKILNKMTVTALLVNGKLYVTPEHLDENPYLKTLVGTSKTMVLVRPLKK